MAEEESKGGSGTKRNQGTKRQVMRQQGKGRAQLRAFCSPPMLVMAPGQVRMSGPLHSQHSKLHTTPPHRALDLTVPLIPVCLTYQGRYESQVDRPTAKPITDALTAP